MTVAFDVTLKRKQELDQTLKRKKKPYNKVRYEKSFLFFSRKKKKKLGKRTFDRVTKKIAPKQLIINHEEDPARR